MKKTILLPVLILPLFLGACKDDPAPQRSESSDSERSYSPPPPRRPQETNYTVRVSDTTITDIKLRDGDEVTIPANGRVTFGKWYGSRGPDGGSTGDTYAYDDDYSFGALLYKYGSWSWDEAGSHCSFTADGNGYLEFRLNDTTQDDNSGSFTVKVTVVR